MKFHPVTVDHLPEEGVRQLPDTLWPFLWFFIRQVKWRFLMISACFTISTALMSLTSYFIKLFVDALDGLNDRSHMIDQIFWIAMGYIILCVLLQSIFRRIGDYMVARTYARFTNMVRRQLSIYMADHSYMYFQNDFAGRLSSKVTETAMAIRMLIGNFNEAVVFSFVSFIVSFILLASAGIGQLLIITFIGCLYVCVLKVYLPQLKVLSKDAEDRQSILRGRYVDILTNILQVKLFARKTHEDKTFKRYLKRTAIGYERKNLKLHEFVCWLDIIMKMIWLLPALYALYSWQNNAISTGDVAMVLSLSVQLGFNMWGFSFTVSSFFENLG